MVTIILLMRLNTFHASAAERLVRRTRTYVRDEYRRLVNSGTPFRYTARRNPALFEGAKNGERRPGKMPTKGGRRGEKSEHVRPQLTNIQYSISTL